MVRFQNKNQLVHRVVYEVKHGKLNGLDCLHRCNNPRCINPDHLYSGTQKENMIYASSLKRQWKQKLLPEHVLEIRRLANSGMSHKEISLIYDVTRRHIWDVVNKKRFGWLQDEDDINYYRDIGKNIIDDDSSPTSSSTSRSEVI